MKLSCVNCGANLIYKIGTHSVICVHCMQEQDIKNLDFKRPDIESNLYTCSSCGAKLSTINNAIIHKCNFCGSDNFIQTKTSLNINDNKIIPFNTTKEDLIKNFKKHIGSNTLSNPEFFSEKNIIETTGIYIPVNYTEYSLQYDSTGLVLLKDNAGSMTLSDSYTYKASYNLHLIFDKLKTLPDNIFNSLLQFDFGKATNYSPYYMLGFASSLDNESIIIKRNRVFNTIRQYLKTDTKNSIVEQAINTCYKNKEIIPNANEINNENSEIIDRNNIYNYKTLKNQNYYVPIWLCAYSLGSSIYYFAMNGQNGKIVSTLPVDRQKAKQVIKQTHSTRSIEWIVGFIVLVSILSFLINILKENYELASNFSMLSILILCIPILIPVVLLVVGIINYVSNINNYNIQSTQIGKERVMQGTTNIDNSLSQSIRVFKTKETENTISAVAGNSKKRL